MLKQKAWILLLIFFFFGIRKSIADKIDSLKAIIISIAPSVEFTLADTSYFNSVSLLNKEYYLGGESDSMNKYALSMLAMIDKFKKSSTSKIEQATLNKYQMLFNRQAGISYFNKGDYTSQLKYFQRFLTVAQELNSINDIATAYVYIATCHRELEDYDKSFEYSKKAIEVLKNFNSPTTLASVYALMGSYYMDKKVIFDSAYYFRKQTYLLYKSDKSKTHFLAAATLDLIELFHRYRKTDSCRVYLNEVKTYVEKNKNPEHVMTYYTYLGRVNLSDGKAKEAVGNMREARSMADETEELEDNSQINRNLALALAADGKIEEAFNVLDSAFDEYSTDLGSEKIRSLTEVQMNFNFEKERYMAVVELKKQKQMRYYVAGFAIVLMIFAIFIFQRYRERHKTSLELAEKNRVIEKAYSDLRDAQDDLVETEKQREAQSIRVRIARDIHDDIGSGLTKITMLSDVLKKKVAQPEFTESLSKITSYSKGVSASLGEIVWAINPANDSVNSLVTYMKAAAHNLLDDSGVNYRLNFPKEEIKTVVHPEIKRNIYLVMKEAIHNSIKYSKAENVDVAFDITNDNFQLTITDNGVGFNAESINANDMHVGGNGLLNMKNRMRQHNNSLQVISSQGNGCKIIAKGKLV